MKANTSFLLLIFALTISSCAKEDPDPMGGENPILEDQLELTFPLSEDAVHYCCFQLTWEGSENDGKYQVQISESNSFDSLVFDTLVQSRFVDFPATLTPSNKYYWRVIPDQVEESKVSEFKIIDYVERLSGSHDASIYIYKWLMGGTTLDTIEHTTLTIKEGTIKNSITYSTPEDISTYNVPFLDKRSESYIRFDKELHHPLHANYINYSMETDSIFIVLNSGGNGGGANHSIVAHIAN